MYTKKWHRLTLEVLMLLITSARNTECSSVMLKCFEPVLRLCFHQTVEKQDVSLKVAYFFFIAL